MSRDRSESATESPEPDTPRPPRRNQPNRGSNRRSGRRPSNRGRGKATPPDIEPIEVTIERIVGDGKGIGFHDGQTVFVPETAPGDTVRAKVRSHRGKVIQAQILEVLEPSPQRVEAPCPYFDVCGGCDFQQFSYEDQLATKVTMIQDSLRRIGKIDPLPEIPITASPNSLEYRSRAEWQIDQRQRKVGYFMANSHQVVDVEMCPIASPNLNTLLATLREDFTAGMVSRQAYEYRGVEGDVGLVLEPTGASRSQLVLRTVGDKLFRYTADCFFQPNIPVAERVLERVLEIADVAMEEHELAIDLYSGVGLFTAHMADRFSRVIGVEVDKNTTRFAAENTGASDEDSNVRIVTAPVEQWIAEDRSPLGKVALVVFDPPRAGAGQKVVEGMVRMNPTHIAAVSCDPATFSRDIRGLLDGGYELVSVDAFDMFPQTHHVELVGHLQRRETL